MGPDAERGRVSAENAIQALILDAALRQSLVSVRALGRAGVSVGAIDCSPHAPAFHSRWAKLSTLVPDCANDPKAYVDALIALLARMPGAVLITSHDGTIETLRMFRSTLEGWATLALANEAALSVAVDKSRTLEIAEALRMPIPRSVTVRVSEDLPAALAEVGYPAVAKPVRSWAQGDGTGKRLLCQAVRDDCEAGRAIEPLLRQGPVLLQQWVAGRREAIHLFYARGTIWAQVAQVAHRMNGPLGGSSVLRETIPLPADASEIAQRLVRTIDLEGYSEIEFRRDAAGRPVLMEINPRLSASVEVAVRAGVNFPWLLYAWAAGKPLEQVTSYRTGLRMRWLGGDLAFLRATLAGPGRPGVVPAPQALATFMLDFLRPTSYDYLDLGDLRPALVAIWAGYRRMISGRGDAHPQPASDIVTTSKCREAIS